MMADVRQDLRDRLFGGGSFATIGVERGRQALRLLRPPGGDDVARIIDLTLAAPSPVGVRVYHPEPGTALPVLVWAHGGGWCLGDLDTADRTCRALAARGRRVVVSVDYRLAPEAPFPQGLDDVTAVVRWAVTGAGGVEGDPQYLTVGGESSGANLALAAWRRVAASRTAEVGSGKAQLLLVVPVVDLSPDRPSMRADRDVTMPVRDLAWFGELYAPGVDIDSDPAINALASSSWYGLSGVTVVTAGRDPLRDGGVDLVAALERERVPVRSLDYADAGHGFFAAPGDDVGERAVNDVADTLRPDAVWR